MPRHELITQLKENVFLFDKKREEEAKELFIYYENFSSATDALDKVLDALKGLYILVAQNQFTDTFQKEQRELDIAVFSALKAILYGMEKKYNDFSVLPDLSKNTKENIKALQEWSEFNIEQINSKLALKK